MAAWRAIKAPAIQIVILVLPAFGVVNVSERFRFPHGPNFENAICVIAN